jgi:hypothetical protein
VGIFIFTAPRNRLTPRFPPLAVVSSFTIA